MVAEKCDKCQKENLEKLYWLTLIPLKNSTDWIPEAREQIKTDARHTSKAIEKNFCIDCWKSEEKNWREISWDTLNWRNEPKVDKRKSMSQIVFLSKLPNPHYGKEGEFLNKTKPLFWNQPKKQ